MERNVVIREGGNQLEYAVALHSARRLEKEGVLIVGSDANLAFLVIPDEYRKHFGRNDEHLSLKRLWQGLAALCNLLMEAKFGNAATFASLGNIDKGSSFRIRRVPNLMLVVTLDKLERRTVQAVGRVYSVQPLLEKVELIYEVRALLQRTDPGDG